MLGIKIKDVKRFDSGGSCLSFDLKDILAVIGEEHILKSRWLCYDLSYGAHQNGKPLYFMQPRLKLSGKEIIELGSSIFQTYDGRFEARGEGAARHPWLKIVAFDSSWFEVWTSKAWVIEKLKEHFQTVTNISQTASKTIA